MSLGFRHGEYKNSLLDMNRKDAEDNIFRDQRHVQHKGSTHKGSGVVRMRSSAVNKII